MRVLERRYGPKLPLTLGAVGGSAAFALPALAHGALWQIIVSGLLTGAGMGLAFAAMSNAIIEAVPASHTGEATIVNAIVRTIGGSIGTAVIAAVLASDSTPQGLPLQAPSPTGSGCAPRSPPSASSRRWPSRRRASLRPA